MRDGSNRSTGSYSSGGSGTGDRHGQHATIVRVAPLAHSQSVIVVASRSAQIAQSNT